MSTWTIEIPEWDTLHSELNTNYANHSLSNDTPYVIRNSGIIQIKYCSCTICLHRRAKSMLSSITDKQFLEFIAILDIYIKRFNNLPHFSLAQSLFDDCFKNKITGSE